MNTDTRSTAIVLDALARLDPENALIPNVVRWLMVARQDGIWETTQETAWALIALTDWMVVTGELEGDYDYAVFLNDEELAEGAVTPETVDERDPAARRRRRSAGRREQPTDHRARRLATGGCTTPRTSRSTCRWRRSSRSTGASSSSGGTPTGGLRPRTSQVP